MKYVSVVVFFAAALAFAVPQPVQMLPPSWVGAHRVLSAASPERLPGGSNNARGSLDAPLAELTLEQRANAQLAIDPGSNLPSVRLEARAIEQLWNSGNYDAALSRLHELGARVDPARVMVGVNWRTPVPGPDHINWGGNVEVGTRDSIMHYVFDYQASSGALMVGAVRLRGAATGFDCYVSTDNGSSWSETFDGTWGGSSVINDLVGRFNGDHIYFGYLHAAFPESLLVMRFTTAGGYDTFPNGQHAVPAVGAPPGETLTKAALTTFDDVVPGVFIYAFAGTNHHNIYGAFSNSSPTIWNPWNTAPLAGSYYGSLVVTVNPGYTTRHIWLSYRFALNDTTYYPAVGYVGVGDILGYVLLNVTSKAIGTTSIAVRNDTVVMAYDHFNYGFQVYPREVVSYNNGNGWFWDFIPSDTSANREDININGRRTADLAAVYWQSGATCRDFFTTCSGMSAIPWAVPDTVSDTMPWTVGGPQVQPLTPGLYGATFISYPGANLWFNRSDFISAVAENPAPVRPLSALQVLPRAGGARLAFSNPVAGELRLRVYDAGGRLVSSTSRFRSAGPQTWDCTAPTSGVYFASVDGAQHIGSARFFAVK